MTPWERMSPRAIDVTLTAAILVAAVSETLYAEGVKEPRWASALIAAATSLLLLWRRGHPVAMSVLLFALLLPQAAFLADPSERIAIFFPVLVLAYSGAAYAERRTAQVVLAVLLTGVVLLAVVSGSGTAGDIYFPAAVVLLCWLGGRTVRTRGRLAAELHEAAALAAEQREQEAQQAVADERRRIAREMHDVVAHSVSIMVVQAGGARRILAIDPERAEQAAARIRRAGADALAEMNTLLGVLAAAPDGTRAPSLDGLPELVERAGRRGPAGHARGDRHAPAAPGGRRAGRLPGGPGGAHELHQARRRRDHDRQADAGATTRSRCGSPTAATAGRRRSSRAPATGLLGMRERVRPYGGDVRAQPRTGGGYEVAARIPLEREEAGVA